MTLEASNESLDSCQLDGESVRTSRCSQSNLYSTQTSTNPVETATMGSRSSGAEKCGRKFDPFCPRRRLCRGKGECQWESSIWTGSCSHGDWVPLMELVLQAWVGRAGERAGGQSRHLNGGEVFAKLLLHASIANFLQYFMGSVVSGVRVGIHVFLETIKSVPLPPLFHYI